MYNISHESFKFVERASDEYYTLQLLKEFKDTKYQYGNVNMSIEIDPDTGQDYGKLSFSWELIEGDESLKNSEEFENYIGDVLKFIIQDAFDSGEYKIGDKNESAVNSNDNSEELAQQ